MRKFNELWKFFKEKIQNVKKAWTQTSNFLESANIVAEQRRKTHKRKTRLQKIEEKQQNYKDLKDYVAENFEPIEKYAEIVFFQEEKEKGNFALCSEYDLKRAMDDERNNRKKIDVADLRNYIKKNYDFIKQGRHQPIKFFRNCRKNGSFLLCDDYDFRKIWENETHKRRLKRKKQERQAQSDLLPNLRI